MVIISENKRYFIAIKMENLKCTHLFRPFRRWASGRPAWIRRLLRSYASGVPIGSCE